MPDALWWNTFLVGVALGMSVTNLIWLFASRMTAESPAPDADGGRP